MQWSVEEQTIPLAAIKSPVQSINLRVDPNSSHFCLLELRCDPDAESYVLRFDRNGAFNAVMIVPPPAPPAPPAPPEAPSARPEEHHSKSKK